ncbi:aminoglycoside phosphotransferase [Alteribacter lacisalsi]|uniref:Aminoglycoside phosphotransferase n=1 Tax=Alteribacter lacisalsi TaxID=2045244 RepID=A0A2W0H6U6_9BACI|nr:aminoglycoside phosphotransferase family protein [Alteribacter lacisalsi]PYZ96711.1 aminoglycoside phosphotransferase [Alteribacter lacisalsi]
MSHIKIAEGNTADIYLHEDRITKVFKAHLPDTEAEKEAHKQTFARACGLPVPEIFEVTHKEGRQAITMRYAEGRTLGERALENRDQAEDFLRLSIDIQDHIHSFTADPLERMAEKLSRQIITAQLLSPKQQSVLLEKLDQMPSENSLCHGDFHLFNLIQGGGEVAILDWVDASAGNKYADICRTYLLYLTFSSQMAEMYLRLYCGKKAARKEEVLAWLPILAGARLSEHVPLEKRETLVAIVQEFCSG